MKLGLVFFKGILYTINSRLPVELNRAAIVEKVVLRLV